MKKAFTMIELIFVIVIIGILASLAIPRMAANRIDAEASMCELEVSQFSRELINYYTLRGHTQFTNILVSKLTNVNILSNDPSLTSGIVSDGYIINDINYNCDTAKLASFKYYLDNSLKKYVLVMQVYAGATPASSLAYNTLKRSFNIDANTGKYYVF